MDRYEYKVVPAPTKAPRVKGLKGTDQKFATALASLMNELGADGWEYQRSDTLPVEERQGLTGKTTTFQNMLIFRRKIAPKVATEPAQAVVEPVAAAPAPAPEPTPAPEPETAPEPAQVLPSFRPAAKTAPALAVVTEAPKGRAPSLGTATPPDPSPAAPGIDRPAH